jgi:hypothetical protein
MSSGSGYNSLEEGEEEKGTKKAIKAAAKIGTISLQIGYVNSG